LLHCSCAALNHAVLVIAEPLQITRSISSPTIPNRP
jgi:hypothetical protein